MKQIKVEKNEKGYILRPSVANSIGTVVLATLFMLGGGCTWYFAPRIPLAIISSILLIGLGLFLLLATHRHVVIDEEGVHLYRFGRLSRSLPWRHVKAWGIITQRVGRSYYRQAVTHLYFSPISGQTLGTKSIQIEIAPEDEREIAELRLKKYIRQHLQEDDDI